MDRYTRRLLTVIIVVIVLLLAFNLFFWGLMGASSHNVPASTYNRVYLNIGILATLLVLAIFFRIRK